MPAQNRGHDQDPAHEASSVPPYRRRLRYSAGSGARSPGQTPVRFAKPRAPARSTATRVVWKTTASSAAAPITLPSEACSWLALGGSSLSIRDQITAYRRVASLPAMMPQMMPMGL